MKRNHMNSVWLKLIYLENIAEAAVSVVPVDTNETVYLNVVKVFRLFIRGLEFP